MADSLVCKATFDPLDVLKLYLSKNVVPDRAHPMLKNSNAFKTGLWYTVDDDHFYAYLILEEQTKINDDEQGFKVENFCIKYVTFVCGDQIFAIFCPWC